MHIPTIEDDFDYNFKAVIKMMKDDFPELKELSSEDLQDDMWKRKDLQEYFTQKMVERAFEYGGDEMFEDGEE